MTKLEAREYAKNWWWNYIQAFDEDADEIIFNDGDYHQKMRPEEDRDMLGLEFERIKKKIMGMCK